MYPIIAPEALLGSNLPPFLPSMAVSDSLLTSTAQNSLDPRPYVKIFKILWLQCEVKGLDMRFTLILFIEYSIVSRATGHVNVCKSSTIGCLHVSLYGI